jgi:hypothetical protein
MIGVIRDEANRRADANDEQAKDDTHGLAGDTWLFTDLPFIREFCILILIGIWHQVERELVWLAACAADTGEVVDAEEYRKLVSIERDLYRSRKTREAVLAKLGITTLPDWMLVLKFIAECYKHDPAAWPDRRLLDILSLPTIPTERLVRWYASLPESSLIEDGLVRYLGLPKEANFCDIADEFLSRAEQYLAELRQRPSLFGLRRAPVSLVEFEG